MSLPIALSVVCGRSFPGSLARPSGAVHGEGRSNAGIARRLWITEGTIEKHVRSVLAKLGLDEADDAHRPPRGHHLPRCPVAGSNCPLSSA